MFGLACSKFGLKISGTCSRCSKFDPPKFEEFEVRFFDVRSKTKCITFSPKGAVIMKTVKLFAIFHLFMQKLVNNDLNDFVNKVYFL